MGAPLSSDLRERVVDAYKAGDGTYEEIAIRFGVGRASVNRWLRLHRERGELKPLPLPGRTPKLDEHGRQLLRRLVQEKSDSTLEELAGKLREQLGIRLVASAVHKQLAKMGFSRKKKTFMQASEKATRPDS